MPAPTPKKQAARPAVKPGGPTGAEFGKYIDADIKTFSDVVQAAKLTFQ